MRYRIILDVKASHPCFPAFKAFSRPLTKGGRPVLELFAANVRFDGRYVQATLLEPEDVKGLEIVIPHEFVALAYGEEGDRRIGFQSRA